MGNVPAYKTDKDSMVCVPSCRITAGMMAAGVERTHAGCWYATAGCYAPGGNYGTSCLPGLWVWMGTARQMAKSFLNDFGKRKLAIGGLCPAAFVRVGDIWLPE